MPNQARPLVFWILVTFQALSVPLLLMGQTMAVFDYGLTVRLGLQESPEQVGEFGVQMNRAFGVGDTVAYIPLMLASLVGLWLRRRWALLVTAAVAGVSVYWSVTIGCVLLFQPGTPGYSYVPGPEIWVFVGAYLVFGIWSFVYLLRCGERLVER